MKLTKTILEQYVREILEEGHDSESDTAQKQLLKISEYSDMLMDLVADKRDLPEEIQSRLAVIQNDIHNIYHHLHDEETLHEEILEEV
jgi:hypothetical protein